MESVSLNSSLKKTSFGPVYIEKNYSFTRNKQGGPFWNKDKESENGGRPVKEKHNDSG